MNVSPTLLPPLLVVLPMLAGAVLVFFRGSATIQRTGLIVTTGVLLAIAVGQFFFDASRDEPFVVVFAGWDAPVGITFHVDGLSALMVLVASFVGFCGALYAAGEIGRSVWRRHYALFYLLLLAGINGAFLTGDLFNLFVWFEVMLISSFAMMILGRRKHTVEGATKYVVINMVSSFFFLAGLGVLYGKVGSLNLVDIAQRVVESENDPLILTSAALLLIAFGIKSGVFPLYFWLPASYPHTGFTTAAVFGGLLTKVGVYSLFRVFGGAFRFSSEITGELFLFCGAATMIVGVLGAASQFHVRRILSFHIVSQIGYLVFGLGLFTVGAFAAAIFYTAHHILVKTNLFFAAGLIARTGGSERLERVGGLLSREPILAVLFLIPALSLGGIPPLSGFFAKFLLLREAFREEAWVVAAIAIVVGIVTLFSMTKIWAEAFWKDSPGGESTGRPRRIQWVPVTLLAVSTVLFGLFAQPLYEVSERAAVQLFELSPAPIPSEAPAIAGHPDSSLSPPIRPRP